MKTSTKDVKVEEDFCKFIIFNQSQYADAFNLILYNQLYKQAQRNDRLKLPEVNLKIAATETRALQFYKLVGLKERIKTTTYEDLEREAATHFREIINRLNNSEETKGGENKTKYSFL